MFSTRKMRRHEKLRPFLISALCVLAVLTSLLTSSSASASHFRYGNMYWTVPDPQTQPNTVAVTMTYAIVLGAAPNLHDITVNFGDGTNTGEVIGPIIGTGVDAGGQQFDIRQLTVSHTYAAAGTYTAFFEDCCRIAAIINGGGGNANYRVEAKIVLQPGNTSGPISASPAIVQLQLGGIRTYTWPAIDSDGDPITCRLGTEAETGFPNPVPVVPNPPGPGNGGQSPLIQTVTTGCQLTWDMIDAQVGQRYVVHLVVESTHAGQISSTSLDLMVEIISPPPPVCMGSGVFIADPGEMMSVMMTGTHNLASALTLSSIDAPASATLMPGGSGLSPFVNTFSWTPQTSDIGTTIVVLNYTNSLNHTGTCFLTIQVPDCADFGDACTSGIGECATEGTNVCAGPGQTVCAAVVGAPTNEVCDGLDNDCDGATDDGNPGGSVFCLTGLPGLCGPGVTACMNGALACLPNVAPGMEVETCDDEDEDCDAVIDNGFDVGSSCTAGAGVCEQSGTIACDGAGGAECSATPGTPEVEVCDGKDNDCDGTDDDGDPGGGVVCPTGLPGACSAGTTSCVGGAIQCVPNVMAGVQSELCNDEDDDCDGATDEGFDLGGTCTSGLGLCEETGTIVCDGAGGPTCDALPGVPVEETCGDTLDQDCDGVADNGCDNGVVPCSSDADCGGDDGGTVCDPATDTCVPGCRGTGGNGCPTGSLCTSQDETIGECKDGGTGGAGSGGSAGGDADGYADFYDCAYSPGQGQGAPVTIGMAILALGLLSKRQRRQPGREPRGAIRAGRPGASAPTSGSLRARCFPLLAPGQRETDHP